MSDTSVSAPEGHSARTNVYQGMAGALVDVVDDVKMNQNKSSMFGSMSSALVREWLSMGRDRDAVGGRIGSLEVVKQQVGRLSQPMSRTRAFVRACRQASRSIES